MNWLISLVKKDYTAIQDKEAYLKAKYNRTPPSGPKVNYQTDEEAIEAFLSSI